MKVFICTRSEENHDGALIVAANNRGEALVVYGEHENYYNRNKVLPIPKKINQLANVHCTSDKPGVIYDDYSR